MAKKNVPIQYPVGIEDLFIVMMNGGKDTVTDLPDYMEDVYEQSNIVKLGIAGNNSKLEKWASNQLIISIMRNTKFTLTFDLAGIATEVKDKMTGILRKKGIHIETANTQELPFFAVGVVFPLNDGTKVARWYPRCQLTPSDESHETLKEELEIVDQQYVIEALPLLFNKSTKVDFYSGDNSAAGITVEDFMKQVICDESQFDLLVPGEVGGDALRMGKAGGEK